MTKTEKEFAKRGIEFYLWGEMRLMEFDEKGRCTNRGEVKRLYQEELARKAAEKEKGDDS